MSRLQFAANGAERTESIKKGQLRYCLLQIMRVVEYPNGDGSYFRCICHL